MRPAAASASGAVPWVPTTGTPPRRWRHVSPRRSRIASGWSWRSLTRRLRPTRKAQHAEGSSNHDARFLANLWQMALRAEGEDALCLAELRGFEPLTPCMPSRDTSKSSLMKPRITSRHTEAVVVAGGVLRGLVWLELLPRCCPPNDRELHVPRCSTTPREEILKAARTGRHASQLGRDAGRTESRAGRPARRPRVRSG